MSAAAAALSRFSRAPLFTAATPLERLERLSDKLGVELWVKRDDLIGLGFGGNKVRQLEFYFGAAMAQGADTVLITGAVQSNYVRTAAAAARSLGMAAVVQLEDRVPGMDETYRTSGNVLLDRLLGAEIAYYPEGEDEAGADRALRERAEALRAEGRVPYVIPLGADNPPLGALGYIAAADEIAAQGADFDAVVVASGSGQTHGGLLTGLRLLGLGMPVWGICVRRNAASQAARMAGLLERLSSLLGRPSPVGADDVLTRDDVLAPGYGRVGEEAHDALLLMAREQGLFLDPVYTAKVFAGLIRRVRSGEIEPGSRVLLIHTGGLPSLFAYQNALGLD